MFVVVGLIIGVTFITAVASELALCGCVSGVGQKGRNRVAATGATTAAGLNLEYVSFTGDNGSYGLSGHQGDFVFSSVDDGDTELVSSGMDDSINHHQLRVSGVLEIVNQTTGPHIA